MSDTIPEFLRPFFWDTSLERIRLPDHDKYCIERLLEVGDDEAIRWVWRTFGEERIAAVVRESRAISRKTANFWAIFLDIPREQIRCFSKPSLLKQGSFSQSWGN